MPTTVTRKVKGSEYLYFRERDPEQKEYNDTYLGKKRSPEAEEKNREAERDAILKKVKTLRPKLVKLNGFHSTPGPRRLSRTIIGNA